MYRFGPNMNSGKWCWFWRIAMVFVTMVFQGASFGFARNPYDKSDSVATSPKAIQWPYVYPEFLKINIQAGTFKAVYALDPQPRAYSFGISGELLWNQVLFGGLGFELNFLPETDSLRGGNLYRLMLHTGAIVQLDDADKHHILLHLRPGYSWVRSTDGNGAKFGISLGLGYEYGLKSGLHISPEIMYHLYGQPSGTLYGLKVWTFGLRLTFGW